MAIKLADAVELGVGGWREVHAALIPHNERGDSTAGYLFEEFAKYFFLTAPEYKDEFKNVWAEAEIPTRVRKKLTLAKRDHGVDLLLEDHEGRFHAVQCKFKTDQSKTLGWTKDRLSSWLAESDEAQGLIMFTNASGIDKQSTLKAAKKDFTLVTVGDLVSLSPETIESILRLARGKAPKKTKRLKPYPHQRRAINDVVKGFKKHDRGQLILPCGAGKTLASLWLKERLGAKRTLVLVPSLALLRQMRREWAAQQKTRLPYLCVCSEKDIDKDKRDAIVTHTFEVPGHVTTQPDEIAEFANEHDELVVYSTYQSLQAVVDAGVEFDLAICDEAHKTATARHNEFALVHDNALKAEKRLYMTATPRVLSYQAKNALGEDAFAAIADMSDEETFGPDFHRMSFADAIEQGILVDYKIVVVGVSDREVHKHIEQRTYLEDASADQVATSLALQKVMKKHGLAHGLTFHSNVKRAKLFTELHKKRTRKTDVEHVNGSMSTNDRLVLLDEFKDAPRAVMTNARCLTEGVDVPAIDCVAFVDPKHSKVDIVQAAGRALRLPRGDDEKPYGVILIPIFYEVGEDPEEIASSGVFKNVFEVVRAMADQDERLQAEITSIRLGAGKREPKTPLVDIDFGERLVLQGFEDALKASLVECVVDRSVSGLDVRISELKRFYAQHGHFNLPTTTPLGFWVAAQRSKYKTGRLSKRYLEALNAIGFSWDRTDVELQDTAGLISLVDAASFLGCTSGHVHQLVKREQLSPEGTGLSGGHITLFFTRETLEAHRKLLENRVNATAFGKIFGVTGSTVGGWVKEGIIRAVKVGTEQLIPLAEEAAVREAFALTLTPEEIETKSLVSLQAFAKLKQLPVSKIRSRVKSDRLTPAGYFFSSSGVSAYFRPEQPARELTEEDERAIAIYDDPRSAPEIAAEYGVSKTVVHKIKSGKTFSHATSGRPRVVQRPGVSSRTRVMLAGLTAYKNAHGHTNVPREESELGAWVHRIREEKRAGRTFGFEPELEKLGFSWLVSGETLTDTTGLLSEAEFAEALGYSAAALCKWRMEGRLVPEGYAVTTGGLGPFYHPSQVRQLRRSLGITLESTEGLLPEREIRSQPGFSRFKQYAEKHGIKPAGYALNGRRVTPYYSPEQVDELKQRLGVTLETTEGLLSAQEFIEATGFKELRKYVKRGLIEPVGYGLGGKPITAYFSLEQVPQLKSALGITLERTDALLTETELAEAAGTSLTALGKLRKKGVLVPAGFAMGSSGVAPFYRPEQVQEVAAHLRGPNFSNEKVLAIYNDPRTTKEIAEDHQVSTASVYMIKSGKSWAHVTGHKTGAAE